MAIAKLRVGDAAGTGAAIAHQVHGAMGFTYEHTLHHSTRRLWGWREEFGNETLWAERLGRMVAAAGADALWPFVTAEDREADDGSNTFQFDPIELPPECKELRQEVRAFLKQEIEAGTFSPSGGRSDNAALFAKKVGAKGWIGMTWPKEYGGHGRTQLERYVVTEEMLAHRAPTRHYSTADRQSGPVLLRYGQEEVKKNIVPRICSGELCFCIGLSRAQFRLRRVRRLDPRDQDRWRLAGQRPQDLDLERAPGRLHDRPAAHLEQDPGKPPARADAIPRSTMKSQGITIRPIINLTGAHDFNEVIFDDVFVPDLHMIGEVDMAWKQASAELAYERSGPDRWLETLQSLVELVRVVGPEPSERQAEGIGREVAHLATMRRMSLSVAGMLQAGKTPAAEASIVKDLGTNFEQALPNKVRLMAPVRGDCDPDSNDDRFEQALNYTTLIAPKLTIQGGTREILRGIIARGLGLR